MKFSECLNAFPNDRFLENFEVNPMEIAEHYYFHRHCKAKAFGIRYPNKHRDYLEEALALMLEERMDFISTANSTHLVHRFIDITCPRCGDKMKYSNCCGSEHMNVIYKCDSCGTELTLHLENFSVKFKE